MCVSNLSVIASTSGLFFLNQKKLFYVCFIRKFHRSDIASFASIGTPEKSFLKIDLSYRTSKNNSSRNLNIKKSLIHA